MQILIFRAATAQRNRDAAAAADIRDASGHFSLSGVIRVTDIEGRYCA